MAEDRSKLDQVQQARKIYDPCANADRVINACSLIDKSKSRIDLAYRIAPNCCCVCTMTFYNDVVAEINEVTTAGDSCANLCSKYFTLYSAKDSTQFRVWYDVGCMGTAPTAPCVTLIEINIASCDAASVVALATQQQINSNCNFCASVLTSVVTVTNASIGLSTATANGCGLCSFSYDNTNSGENALQYVLCFVYDACDRLITVDRS